MGIEDRDYFQEDRARRERKQDYVDMHYDPKAFRGSAAAGGSTLPSLREVFAKPKVAWGLGLLFGVLAGISGTAIVAVTNIDWLDKPLWWAIHVIDWVTEWV